MAHYIDGYVFPLPRERLDEYQHLADAIAQIWKNHGALDYREFVGDDLNIEGTQPFPELISAAEDEVIVFGWVAFESREARDQAHRKVASDPRVADLMASSAVGFDAQRMGCGGFVPLVPKPAAKTG